MQPVLAVPFQKAEENDRLATLVKSAAEVEVARVKEEVWEPVEGAEGGEIDGGGVVVGVVNSCPEENPGGAIGEVGGALIGVEGGVVY
ncbi:hypothetical protein Tco_1336643 [Tanacetum coccineum]